jgi:hypothetical protein
MLKSEIVPEGGDVCMGGVSEMVSFNGLVW